MRNAFSKAILKIARERTDLVILAGDVGFSVFDDFRKEFPNRFFNMGISEQNMMGVAAGLAKCGKKVIVYSIIPFVTLRCIEQIRNDICYQDLDVIIVGTGSGITYGYNGFSHHAIDDIGCLKPIPNITILSPCDPREAEKLICDAVVYKHPVYFRLGKNEIKFTDANCMVGKISIIKQGKDLAIIAYGSIITEIMKANEMLSKNGLDATIVSCHTIKPLDKEKITTLLKEHDKICVIEEHNKIGGLGESIISLANEMQIKKEILHIAINDSFSSQSGDYTYLKKMFGLDAESIVNRILRK